MVGGMPHYIQSIYWVTIRASLELLQEEMSSCVDGGLHVGGSSHKFSWKRPEQKASEKRSSGVLAHGCALKPEIRES